MSVSLLEQGMILGQIGASIQASRTLINKYRTLALHSVHHTALILYYYNSLCFATFILSNRPLLCTSTEYSRVFILEYLLSRVFSMTSNLTSPPRSFMLSLLFHDVSCSFLANFLASCLALGSGQATRHVLPSRHHTIPCHIM